MMCFIENNKILLCASLNGFTASAHTAEGGHWLVGLSNNLFGETFTCRANSLAQSLLLLSPVCNRKTMENAKQSPTEMG